MPPFLKHYLSSDSESESGVNKRPTVAGNVKVEKNPSPTATKLPQNRFSSTTISELHVKEEANMEKQSDFNKEVSVQLDDIHIPDAWSFAVVISPRSVDKDIAEEMVTVRSDVTSTSTLIAPRTEILRTSFNNGKQKEVSTIEPAYSPSDPTISDGESRGTSVAPKNRVPTDKTGLLEIQKADPLKFQLLWFRTVIQRRKNAVEKHGLASLKDNDFKVLTKTLRELAFYSWPDDPTEYLNSTGIGRAVKVLTRTVHYGDSVAELAKKLTDRWASGDFRPGAISTEDNDLISIDDDSESEDEHLQTRPSYGQGLVRHIMRGVIRYRNAKGNLTMKLDPEFRKRDSDIFGHNGLSVGDWWPFQLCALRDGAHGSRQGGIAGRMADGAFSIVVSGQSEYNDRDSGLELFYSGTHGDAPSSGDTAAQLTNATKALIMSMTRQTPVRVIRKGPSDKNRLYPAVGFRYDGLYTVKSREVVRERGKRDYYRFKLVRNDGQVPLDNVRNRPTRDEYAAYQAVTSSS